MNRSTIDVDADVAEIHATRAKLLVELEGIQQARHHPGTRRPSSTGSPPRSMSIDLEVEGLRDESRAILKRGVANGSIRTEYLDYSNAYTRDNSVARTDSMRQRDEAMRAIDDPRPSRTGSSTADAERPGREPDRRRQPGRSTRPGGPATS